MPWSRITGAARPDQSSERLTRSCQPRPDGCVTYRINRHCRKIVVGLRANRQLSRQRRCHPAFLVQLTGCRQSRTNSESKRCAVTGDLYAARGHVDEKRVTRKLPLCSRTSRKGRDSGALGNRHLQLCGRTTTGQWIRFEWPIRAETVPQFCWWPDHRGPGQRLMALRTLVVPPSRPFCDETHRFAFCVNAPSELL